MTNPYEAPQDTEEPRNPIKSSTLILAALWACWALAPQIQGCVKDVFNNANDQNNVAPNNGPQAPQPQVPQR